MYGLSILLTFQIHEHTHTYMSLEVTLEVHNSKHESVFSASRLVEVQYSVVGCAWQVGYSFSLPPSLPPSLPLLPPSSVLHSLPPSLPLFFTPSLLLFPARLNFLCACRFPPSFLEVNTLYQLHILLCPDFLWPSAK